MPEVAASRSPGGGGGAAAGVACTVSFGEEEGGGGQLAFAVCDAHGAEIASLRLAAA